MTTVNAKGIVKLNFKVAFFDAMSFNYFRDDYERCEEIVDKAMEQKLDTMNDDDIDTFAIAVISGNEIVYDKEKEDFYIA